MPSRAPKALQRHGITQVADNLPPGVVVAGFERDFALIFSEELAARFILGPGAKAAAPVKAEAEA